MDGIASISQQTAPAPAAWKAQEARTEKQEPVEQRPAPRRDILAAANPPGRENDSAGVYQVSRDEDGTPKFVFDQPPQKAEKAPSARQAAEAPEPGEGGKVTTVNTDKVDAEIKKLEKKTAELEREIARTQDPARQEKLRRQLEQVEQEFQAKNNDAYRRQHAEITSNQAPTPAGTAR